MGLTEVTISSFILGEASCIPLLPLSLPRRMWIWFITTLYSCITKDCNGRAGGITAVILFSALFPTLLLLNWLGAERFRNGGGEVMVMLGEGAVVVSGSIGCWIMLEWAWIIWRKYRHLPYTELNHWSILLSWQCCRVLILRSFEEESFSGLCEFPCD